MSNVGGKINLWVKFTNIPEDGKSFERLGDYCKRKHISKTSVRRAINAQRVRAFKFKGNWYMKEYQAYFLT
ncbi:hypothetical protein Lepto7376_4527 [[Leptolyngbya] sp. PCC 7376]|uniref:hypothetical protein n=1 Tax=[Leptolyngbya] sp. PCC 7376 TaxID=111781 RepID=UPI00029F1679|nr:hypothetical protein [[Leptolyngbya] sp. PCC 7376]AFY40625.1 hypothetical protein Lepto7376_4527 [[Leptolyngbya] sp. PCC 7376]